MIFPKLTRKAIAKAGGRPVAITWPPDSPEPVKGNKYSIQSSATKKGEEKLIVLTARQKGSGGWICEVRLDADPHRPCVMSAKVAKDPNNSLQFRAETEPEQVPAGYQRLLGEEARFRGAGNQAGMRLRSKAIELESRLNETRRRNMGGAAAKVEHHLRSVRGELADLEEAAA